MTQSLLSGPPQLADIVDLDELELMVSRGYVRVGRHPRLAHTVLDYTPAAQYEQVWNPTTKLCRGLLVSDDPFCGDATVLARPFGKFANAAEHGPDSAFGPLPADRRFEAFEKVDGSLAIAYIDADGNPAISTRGSYDSTQARAATELWRREYADVPLPDTSTLLFEFVAPWNRIVVGYGDVTELVLLAHIDRRTGADLPLPEWPGRTARRFDGLDSFDEIVAHIAALDAAAGGAEAEGFVIRFEPDQPSDPSLRVKMKLATYVELHRVVTNMTPRSIWEHLAAGGDLGELAGVVPDEYHDDLRRVVGELTGAFDRRVDEAQRVAASLEHLAGDRKQLAAAVFAACGADRALAGLVFATIDGRDISEAVWKSLRPAHDPTARIGGFGKPSAHSAAA